MAALVQGSNGTLYGTTSAGGVAGQGTLFTINTNGGDYRILHSFTDAPSDGGDLRAALMEASDGVLYGTTSWGGPYGAGLLFKVSKNGSGYSVLHNFTNAPGDGAKPFAAPLESSDGALYGPLCWAGSDL